MQAIPECLELTHSLHNFTLGNQTKHIMKKNAGKGNSMGENNTPKQKKISSKNGKIKTYLSSRYEFRYNTVLGRTEYRRMNSSNFTKVGRYEINTLRREIDNDIGIITSSENLYSIIESSFSPRINPIQEHFIKFFLFTESHSRTGKLRCGAQSRKMATISHQMARGSSCQRNGRP